MKEPLHIKVEGVEQAIRDLKMTELRKRGQLMRAVALTAVQGTTRMKRMVGGGGTGRWYGAHRASAPFQPPARDLGDYVNSWHWRIDTFGLGGDVYTEAKRANALEFGYPPRNLLPRPHAGPVAEQMKGDWIKNAKDALGD